MRWLGFAALVVGLVFVVVAIWSAGIRWESVATASLALLVGAAILGNQSSSKESNRE